MRVDCKICKRDLTSETIKMLEGKIKRVVCPCKDEETKSKYLKEFDLFINKLIEKNGTTNY